MRLIDMEVDRNGTNSRNHIGPLSPGLNAICGPNGSGKSTLLAWLRTIAEERRDENWGEQLPPVSGIVKLQNRGQHYQVTTDRKGRVRFELTGHGTHFGGEQRWDGRIDQHTTSNLTPRQRQAFVGLANASGALDTEGALQQLAQQLGLNTYEPARNHRREELEARARELELRLSRIASINGSRDSLLARQKQLETELATARSTGRGLRYEGHAVEHRRLDERYSVLEVDLANTLQQIEELDREIANCEAELKLLEVGPTVAVGESYRAQLQKLDDRLNRWRQTLRDLKSHREAIEHSATDARLDQQIGDQLSATKDSDPRAAMRSLEAQIMNTRQQLDELVDRYTTIPGYDYRSASAAVAGTGYRPGDSTPHGVYRDASGRTYVGHAGHLPESTVLPETLRSMQKDLHEVCQQLARHEANSATETLKQQTLQLRRCEAELLQSVEKLIEERAALLRRIANEHHLSIEQLTLAFGQWCQCHDHPHLQDWLLSEESNCPTSTNDNSVARQKLMESLEALKHQRKLASVRADECRRQIRDADMHRRGSVVRKAQPHTRLDVDIHRDLQQVNADLADLSDADRIQTELREIEQQLRSLPASRQTSDRFRELTDRHIASLLGPNYVSSRYHRPTREPVGRRYDLVDGIVADVNEPNYETEASRAVPAEIVRLAMRLAMAEAMAQAGELICLVLDSCLDYVHPDIQISAIAHLASIANSDQQITLLTADQRIAERVSQLRGWVGYLNQPEVQPSVDRNVNRQLAALANAHEADKWYHPVVQTPNETTTREFFLHERSLIEELPAIDPTIAARCRALGVDRIGDLLDVDPHWLAENLRVDGVSHRTVVAWQSVASLLCSVRKLRPFDARVLVGAGIQTPAQLASMHPSQLLDRVEHFLTTPNGRKILNSGNSYELSRITSWIASAKGGGRRYDRTSDRVSSGFDSDFAESDNGYSRNRSVRNGSSTRSRSSSRNGVARRRDRDYEYTNYDYEAGEPGGDYEAYRSYYEADSNGRERSRSNRSRSSSSSRSSNRSSRSRRSENSGTTRGSRSYPVVDRSGRSSREWGSRENRSERESSRRTERELETGTVRMSRSESSDHAAETSLKFYLELASPVVDAPSIGPRMAARLEEFGILTVDQLLAANAESLADKLNHRRVDADIICAWQEQARLVCRIPNLRGHDAQLLVACDLTSPEELATMDPATVLAQVSEVAGSKEGQRILRGSKEPDLAEVTDWIAWAADCRTLSAA